MPLSVAPKGGLTGFYGKRLIGSLSPNPALSLHHQKKLRSNRLVVTHTSPCLQVDEPNVNFASDYPQVGYDHSLAAEALNSPPHGGIKPIESQKLHPSPQSICRTRPGILANQQLFLPFLIQGLFHPV